MDGHKRLVATNLWYFLQRANKHRIVLPGTREERNKEIEIESNRRLLASPDPQSLDESHVVGIKTLQSQDWPNNWLWIDALCIDQSDARERMHQVGIMSEIFGRADQVISWLGPAYDNSDHAMNTISTYSVQLSVKHQIFDRTGLSEAICSLCERAYWKRLWAFQELRHAKDIKLMCGDHWLPWDRFRHIWRVVVDIARTDMDACSERLRQSLATRMMTLRTKPMDFSLWNLLKETSNLECADARDRVFALLSVATRGHEGIEADYSPYMDVAGLGFLDETESIPDTVYRQMVQFHLKLNELDFGVVADWRAFLATSALAHRVLRARYAIRPPATLDNVRLDCEFLAGVFGLEDPQMRAFGDRLRPLQGEWSEWARVHNHHAVTRLLDRLD